MNRIYKVTAVTPSVGVATLKIRAASIADARTEAAKTFPVGSAIVRVLEFAVAA